MLNVRDVINGKFSNIRKIETYFVNEEMGYRFNLVTDDISSTSLFGGVATALIFASMLCKKNNWTLRLITRNNFCNLNDYYSFMENMGLEVPDNVESYSDVVFESGSFNQKLEIRQNDVFFATSWWSAKSILDSNITNRIIYILQEVEQYFYDFGDNRLQCDLLFKDERIDFLVNTKLLFDYFCNNKAQNIINNGFYFEPSFVEKVYYAEKDTFLSKKGKHKIFYYGRPNNSRNLYYMGLEVLDKAILEGIIDTDKWEIIFAGKNDSEPFAFSNGYIPKFAGQLSWLEYAELARTIDVAFCLMYTPHPSYPPFDMAASGAVVITNMYENKKDLSFYSNNILTEPLDLRNLVLGIDKAIELSENYDCRKENYFNSKILRDWNNSFGDLLEIFTKKIEDNTYVCY